MFYQLNFLLMNTYLITTIEIALLLVLPLIWFYKQSNWSAKSYIYLIPILYLVWYFTYGLLHELAHLAGVLACGKQVIDYQLIPHFWDGDYGSGFVNYEFKGEYKDFFIVSLPYIRDVFFVTLGYFLIKRKVTSNIFLVGIILILLVFSPLFDITNNYIGFVMGYRNDFNALRVSSNAFVSNLVGISFMLFSVFISIKVLKYSRVYP